jgi:hypothetical protein
MPLRATTPIPIVRNPTEISLELLDHADTESFATAAPAVAAEHKLNVRRIRQLRSNWCWAACVDMVLNYYEQPEIRQCDVVGKKLDEPCCDDPFNADYNVTCHQDDMRSVWEKLGIHSRSHLGQPTGDNGWVGQNKLVDELNQQRPVELGLKWQGSGGHAIIVHGWKNSSNGMFFLVNDPLNWGDEEVPELVNGKGKVLYDELREAYGMGKWRWTWTELESLEE